MTIELNAGPAEGICETTIVSRVEKGIFMGITEKSNKAHPAVPTVDDLWKILKPHGAEKEAEAIVAASDWECLSPATQVELRGNSISNLPHQSDASPQSGSRP